MMVPCVRALIFENKQARVAREAPIRMLLIQATQTNRVCRIQN